MTGILWPRWWSFFAQRFKDFIGRVSLVPLATCNLGQDAGFLQGDYGFLSRRVAHLEEFLGCFGVQYWLHENKLNQLDSRRR